jgi:thiamine kinase-like enzyme
MSKSPVVQAMETDLLTHPSVRAWREFAPGRGDPRSIDVLQDLRKSAVCRLHGMGEYGESIIVKRCQRDTAATETAIYQDILPRAKVSVLRFFGKVHDADEDCTWLFMEDATGEEYSPQSEQHRIVCASWLAALHLATSQLEPSEALSDQGPKYYLELLQTVRETIRRHLKNPLLEADFLGVLERLVSLFDFAESHWNQVEEVCDPMPRVLVHGDLAKKNMRVRTGPNEDVLLVFDWEMAGIGPPALDLIQFLGRSATPDLPTYLSLVGRVWPQINYASLQQLIKIGAIFRTLVAIEWEAWSLEYDSAQKHVKTMRIFESRLDNSIEQFFGRR